VSARTRDSRDDKHGGERDDRQVRGSQHLPIARRHAVTPGRVALIHGGSTQPWCAATGSAAGSQFPFRPPVVAGVAAGVVSQIVLMFWFGFPEVTGRRHLGDHRGGPEPRCVDIGDGVRRDALLIVIEIEDRRAVAGAEVVALSVLCRRVMYLEKEFQKGAVIGVGRS
jgi:hypothetical protein